MNFINTFGPGKAWNSTVLLIMFTLLKKPYLIPYAKKNASLTFM